MIIDGQSWFLSEIKSAGNTWKLLLVMLLVIRFFPYLNLVQVFSEIKSAGKTWKSDSSKSYVMNVDGEWMCGGAQTWSEAGVGTWEQWNAQCK